MKHDKIKNECFKTKPKEPRIGLDAKNQAKQGKLDNVQTIMDRNKDKIDKDKDEKSNLKKSFQNNDKGSKNESLFSQAHL